MKRHIIALFSAIATLVGMAFVAPAAFASNCTTSTDQNTGNTVTVCDEVIGSTNVKVDESLSGKESLALVDKGHVFLSVQTHHMTRGQIAGRCKILPVGTFFWNGFVDPSTGKVRYKAWHVQKGDQKFCVGHDHRWHKYSCNNPVRGKPFHSRPPRKSLRVRGWVRVVNYATWKALLEAKLSKHISASITVENSDHTCQATVNLDNTATASLWSSVLVKSRTSAGALTTAASSIKQQASANQTVEGNLEYQLKLMISDTASAQCTSTSPQPQPQAPTVSIGGKNQVGAGEHATVCADYNVPGNDSATLKFSSKIGSYPAGLGGDTFTVSGMGTQCTEYQAPNDADQPPSDTLTATVRDNQSGLSASDSTPIQITYSTPPM